MTRHPRCTKTSSYTQAYCMTFYSNRRGLKSQKTFWSGWMKGLSRLGSAKIHSLMFEWVIFGGKLFNLGACHVTKKNGFWCSYGFESSLVDHGLHIRIFTTRSANWGSDDGAEFGTRERCQTVGKHILKVDGNIFQGSGNNCDIKNIWAQWMWVGKILDGVF